MLVLEGEAKKGVPAVKQRGLRVVHAAKDGDSTIVAEARAAAATGQRVTVVTADRALQANVAAVATTMSPMELIARL